MSDQGSAPKQDRPALPRDSFRSQRIGGAGSPTPTVKPVVVTPDYGDPVKASVPVEPAAVAHPPKAAAGTRPSKRRRPDNNPFEPYGERSSSRPYALRLPDPIDLVLRQMAAEERTHPLRVIDRILYEHLKRIGRLPATSET